jgi:hypothetical protein
MSTPVVTPLAGLDVVIIVRLVDVQPAVKRSPADHAFFPWVAKYLRRRGYACGRGSAASPVTLGTGGETVLGSTVAQSLATR